MNIGDEIINKIVSGKLFTVGCAKCDESNGVVLWSSGASEQIEAIFFRELEKEATRSINNVIESEMAHVIVGALDSLACLLAEKGHTWTEGERAIYEQAVAIVQGKKWKPEI